MFRKMQKVEDLIFRASGLPDEICRKIYNKFARAYPEKMRREQVLNGIVRQAILAVAQNRTGRIWNVRQHETDGWCVTSDCNCNGVNCECRCYWCRLAKTISPIGLLRPPSIGHTRAELWFTHSDEMKVEQAWPIRLTLAVELDDEEQEANEDYERGIYADLVEEFGESTIYIEDGDELIDPPPYDLFA